MEPRPALPAAYFAAGSSSFTDFIATAAPHLLPGQGMTGRPGEQGQQGGQSSGHVAMPLNVPHGTTIVALTYSGGVLIAGDRRATAGNMIAQRDIEKVFITDSYSAAGFAGAAGMGVELMRLFTVDLEHYEKIEGVPLSLDGKANKLAGMVRSNLAAALQGFVVVPLFVGYDLDAPDPAKAGRIVTFDATGGRYDENAGYHSVGSGSVVARGTLKRMHDWDADESTAVRAAMEALYDAADEDTATGGPDLTRQIFPSAVTINAADGAVRRPDEEIGEIVRAVVEDRTVRSGG
jgi:proteasome beta subunit